MPIIDWTLPSTEHTANGVGKSAFTPAHRSRIPSCPELLLPHASTYSHFRASSVLSDTCIPPLKVKTLPAGDGAHANLNMNAYSAYQTLLLRPSINSDSVWTLRYSWQPSRCDLSRPPSLHTTTPTQMAAC